MAIKLCRKCGVKKSLRFFYKNKGMKDGRLNMCSSCHGAYSKLWQKNNQPVREIYRRRRGTPSIDDSKGRHTIIGRRAEILVFEKLVMAGFEAHIGIGKGADIEFKRKRKIFSVEVKVPTKNVKAESWLTGDILNDRREDDLVAIVYKKKVWLYSMKEHLKGADYRGRKTVSSICMKLENGEDNI